MKYTLFVLSLVILFVTGMNAQSYQGPARGSVTTGVLTSTNSFATMPNAPIPGEQKQKNKETYIEPALFIPDENPISAKDIYVEDANNGLKSVTLDTTAALQLKSFIGLSETNSIPPDPHIAMANDYIVAVVNTDFGIFDKNGNLIKRIAADSWYANVVANPGAFDPKVVYDQFAKRWVMVWLSQSSSPQQAFHLISVSDDSIPTGNWYNYALPSDKNGSTTVANWTDYQGIGFDSLAFYVVGNQFTFGTTNSFQYPKIRMISKADLYANTGGAVNWYDIWDVRYPSPAPTTYGVFHIRPVVPYSSMNGAMYFLNLPSSGGNFACLYKVVNPLNNPTLTGTLYSVTSYSNPPNATQPGGLTQISTNGAQLQNEPIYRNGYVYAIHSIANPTNSAYSSLHYLKLNTANTTVAEQSVFGGTQLSYFFGAITVDKDENVAVAFSRCGDNEFASSYVAPKLKGETTLKRSLLLKAGLAGYVKTFGGTRNRWGDYLGIALDPNDQSSFAVLGEYVAGTNTWGTWINTLRMASYANAYITSSLDTLNVGNVEVGKTSDTLTVAITNFGSSDLTIQALSVGNSQAQILNMPSLPLTMASHGSYSLKIRVVATDTGVVKDSLKIQSNAANLSSLPLKFNVFKINPALADGMYASTGIGNGGKSLKINKTTGAVTTLGLSGMDNIKSIAVNPKTKIIYGVRSSNPVELVRVNSSKGDAYKLLTTSLAALESISFDTSGTLYAATREGILYTIDLTTGAATQKCQITTQLTSIAFNPKSNQLWGSAYKALGTGKDKVFKVNIATGDTTNVGITGFSVVANDLEFDGTGKLFGVKGTAAANNDLFVVDTTTGTGTLVASLGVPNVTALALNWATGVDVDDNKSNSNVPDNFYLGQNYPNPFNPSTSFDFGLPKSGNVKVTIYSVLGETVKVLVDGFKEKGNYRANWFGDNSYGSKVTSGVYFYEVKLSAPDGKDFTAIKKMILMK